MSQLPQAIANWRLTDVQPLAETPTSHVYRAKSLDHGGVVAKLLKPYGADEILGARLMQWFDGDGAARIYDIKDQAVLMEFVPGQTLGDMVRGGRDDEATDIICTILPRLHQPRGTPPNLRPLTAQFDALLTHDPRIWPAKNREDFRFATRLAETLLADSTADTPLHGDFHHDNILQADRGWLVIDPKGLIGDPVYETANLFQNPVGASELAQQPARIEHLANVLTTKLAWDRQRILAWAVAHSAISACWNHNAGNPTDFQMTFIPKLISAYLANPQSRH